MSLLQAGGTDNYGLENALSVLATEETLQAVALLGKYHISGMDIASNPFYFGYLTTTGAWYIKKLDTTSGMTYINGTSGYDAAWSSRASGSYLEFNQLTW